MWVNYDTPAYIRAPGIVYSLHAGYRLNHLKAKSWDVGTSNQGPTYDETTPPCQPYHFYAVKRSLL